MASTVTYVCRECGTRYNGIASIEQAIDLVVAEVHILHCLHPLERRAKDQGRKKDCDRELGFLLLHKLPDRLLSLLLRRTVSDIRVVRFDCLLFGNLSISISSVLTSFLVQEAHKVPRVVRQDTALQVLGVSGCDGVDGTRDRDRLDILPVLVR